MPALDTDVLVRWLVRDDESQYLAAKRLIDDATRSGTPLWVPVTVLLELEWVLRSRYRIARPELIAALDALLSLPELAFGDEAAVERSLWRFKRHARADFADCLHVSLAEGADTGPMLTFDGAASALPGARAVRANASPGGSG